MKQKRFTEQQIAFALHQAEQGTAVEEITHKLGVSEATFYRWKKRFACMGVAELRRLKQLASATKHMTEVCQKGTYGIHIARIIESAACSKFT